MFPAILILIGETFMKTLLLIFLMLLPNFTFALPTVKLISYDYFLHEGEKSINDEQYINTFIKELSNQFKVEQYNTNAARMLKELSNQSQACSFNILKTAQREKQFIFSDIPSSMFLQRRLFGLKETIQNFPEKVSISKLLANNYTFAVITSTSYQELDSTLMMYQHQTAPIIGADSFSRLAKLLLHKRVDFIIDYDMSVNHFLTDEQYSSLESRQIIEYPEFNSGYFACNNSQEGIEFISQINTLMQSDTIRNSIKQYHSADFGPEIAHQIMAIYNAKYWHNNTNNRD